MTTHPMPAPDWLVALANPLGDDHGRQASRERQLPEAHPPRPGRIHLVNRARSYLARCEPAISGQGGHDQTFKVACKLIHGFHLTDDEALQLLIDDYNPRCQPPWTLAELDHKIEQARTRGSSEDLLTQQPPNRPAPGPPRPQPVSRKFSEIVPRPLRWLFESRIPLGKVTVFDGDPDLGKSTVLLDIAARVSSHGMMPDGSQGPCGDVIVMSGEDDPEDTIQPRLALNGANLERVHFLDEAPDIKGEPRGLEIPLDLRLIEQEVARLRARLLVIDPLMAFLTRVDANNDQSVRQALRKLSNMAKRQGCAVICQRHLNKGSSPKAMYRGGGSIAIIGHARVGLLVAKDPDDENRRLLAVVKNNRGPKAPTLRFQLTPETVQIAGEADTLRRVGWCGQSPYTADQLVAPPQSEEQKEEKEEARSKFERAKEFLRMVLAEGPRAVQWCRAEANKVGLSSRTLERAARALNVALDYFNDAANREHTWTLPTPFPDGEMAS